MNPYTPGPWEVTEAASIKAVEADPTDANLDDSQLFPVLALGQGVHRTGNGELIQAAPALAFAWNMVPPRTRRRIFDQLRGTDSEWVEVAIAELFHSDPGPEKEAL